MNDSTLPTPSVNVAGIALTQLPAGSATNNILQWNGLTWANAAGIPAFTASATTSGALSLSARHVVISMVGALTLADGTYDGQEMTVTKNDAFAQVLTPSKIVGFLNITYSAVGQSTTLMWSTALSGWVVKSNFGAVVA